MLKKKRKLIMYNASEIEFDERKNGKTTGETVTKWKYEFFDKDGNVFIGYDDDGVYKNEAHDIEDMVWDEDLAKEYTFQIKVFDGVKKEQLLIE
jgi:hypothetical protein